MQLIRALCVDISAQVVMCWLLCVCVPLNRTVHNKNELNPLGVKNIVAMTNAMFTSLTATYNALKIPVDSLLPHALTNKSNVRLPSRLGLTSASAEL